MSGEALQQFPQKCSYCEDCPCFKLLESGRIVFPEAGRMGFISETAEATIPGQSSGNDFTIEAFSNFYWKQ